MENSIVKYVLTIAKTIKYENDLLINILDEKQKMKYILEKGKLSQRKIVEEINKDCKIINSKEDKIDYKEEHYKIISVLPDVMTDMKIFLESNKVELCTDSVDGRTNSCIDEDRIVEKLLKKFPDIIVVPKIRMWYDILVRDYKFGWIPVNIKTTTGFTSDNVGNLSICVQAYTDEVLSKEIMHNNGKMYKVLLEKLQKKEYNNTPGKDYYFLVVNKENGEVIVNSVLGLSKLTSNNNNLPFQVKWKNNKIYKPKSIKDSVEMFLETVKKPQLTWNEKFLNGIRKL